MVKDAQTIRQVLSECLWLALKGLKFEIQNKFEMKNKCVALVL